MTDNYRTASIVDWLFQTEAIRVSPADQPFWYTSGLIGPYYVNTHWLLGDAASANRLLELIDATREEPLAGACQIQAALLACYRQNAIFQQVTDTIMAAAQGCCDMDNIDYISGGERRDWFFSMVPALMLGKPHLSIGKDQGIVLLRDGTALPCPDLAGARVFHISDLVTEASSYLRAWIPALQAKGANMVASLTVVDRQQGGAAALHAAGVPLHALVGINQALFDIALQRGYLNEEQHRLVAAYLADQYGCMRQFLQEHPYFVSEALQQGGKTAERAQRLLANDLYDLQGN